MRPHTTASSAAGSLRCLPGIERRPKEDAGPPPDVWRDSLTEPRSEPETRLAAAEGEQVADAVRSLIDEQGLAPGEVMVLARRRTVLGHVARALARLGVPHVLAEPLWLHQSPEALDLVALLDVLASPGHDLSLARALRSPLFGAGDDDLMWLARAARSAALPWCRALLEARDLPSAPLLRAQELLHRWMLAAAQLPPHDLLDRVVHEGDLLGRLAAAVPAARRLSACHAVQALLAAALDQDGGRYSTVYGFVRQVRAGRVRAPGAAPAQAVQLLTVHGAKGLEARAVVMADCDPAPRPLERAQVLVDWPVHDPVPRRVAFVHAAALPPSLAEAWDEHIRAQEREEINGLYVAMTRAREWLVLSRTEPHRAPPQRSWWARVQPHAECWTPPPAAALDRQAAVLVPVAPRWHQTAPPVAAPAAEDARAARLGQAVHRVLEWAAGAAPPADLDGLAVAAALAFGLPGAQAGAVRKMAAAVLGSPQCAPFFGGPGLIWAGNEVPVSWGGQSLRIDRLVALARDGRTTWWVLDYKLQTHADELARYRGQLQGYVDAVRALQPGDTVHGAFISSQGTVVAL